MAGKKRTFRPKRYGFFFLNRKLYRTVHADIRSNLLYAIDAEDGKTKSFLYSDIRKHAQRAFRVGTVADMLKCHVSVVRAYERIGKVRPPARWSGPNLDYENKTRYYSEDDVREFRSAMAEAHIGRPRKDGIIITKRTLPTAEQLEAMLREDNVLYEEIDGQYVPVWKAKF